MGMKEKNTEPTKFMGLGMQNANDTFSSMYGSDEGQKVEIREEDAAIMERMMNAGSGWGDLEQLPDHQTDFTGLTPAELDSRGEELQYYYDKAFSTGDAESCRTAMEIAGGLSRVGYGNAAEQYRSLELKYRQIRDKAYQEALQLQNVAKKPQDFQKAYEAFSSTELVGFRDCDSRAKLCLGRTVKTGPTAMEDLKNTMTAPKTVRIHLGFLGFEENKRIIGIVVVGAIIITVFFVMAVVGFSTGGVGFIRWVDKMFQAMP
ncbi:MAG: hypothetical protein J5825_11665 [Lachnospiraceae bacterium]|nr:hypothetical protein [Lachnospiraceae bacterium]